MMICRRTITRRIVRGRRPARMPRCVAASDSGSRWCSLPRCARGAGARARPRGPRVARAADRAAHRRRDEGAAARGASRAAGRSATRPTIFAKVGDSITAGSAFLAALDCRGPRLGSATATCAAPSRSTAARGRGARASPASRRPASAATAAPRGRAGPSTTPCAVPDGGRTTGAAAASRRLECEYRDLRPAVAIVMYGTNDVGRVEDPAHFRARPAGDRARLGRLGRHPDPLDHPAAARPAAAWAAASRPTTPRSRGWPARSRCRCSTTGARCRGRG